MQIAMMGVECVPELDVRSNSSEQSCSASRRVWSTRCICCIDAQDRLVSCLELIHWDCPVSFLASKRLVCLASFLASKPRVCLVSSLELERSQLTYCRRRWAEDMG